MRELSARRALFSGVFVVLALLLGGLGIAAIAQRHWQWQDTYPIRASFTSIAGLEPGAKVYVQGMDAGVVAQVKPPGRPGDPVELTLNLDSRLRPLLRVDSTSRIATQGVLGAKVVELSPGSPNAAILEPGALIQGDTPLELSDLLQRASASLDRLDQVAVAATQSMEDVQAIAETVRRGEGTLGRLVQDDQMYNEMVSLSERGQQTLANLDENLMAIKGVWPISSYFNDRGFTDMEELLYQPGSVRDRRILETGKLFQNGRAVLTNDGKRHLDELAVWYRDLQRPESTQVVIVATTNTAPEGREELAQILTQQQADAVRTYLVEQHAIDKLPWYRFSRRKVAAVGFGTKPPTLPGFESGSFPPQRVELVLYTPASG